MAAYHIKGNTIHSALHINIESKLTALSHSEFNTLRSKYSSLQATFYEEVSILARSYLIRVNRNSRKYWGQKPFGGQHFIALGDFCQMVPVKVIYIFKDDDNHYGVFTVNLWTAFLATRHACHVISGNPCEEAGIKCLLILQMGI